MTDRAELLGQLADDVAALTRGRQHEQPLERWSPTRNRKFDKHSTAQPSLIGQLRELTYAPVTAERVGRSVPASRTPEGADAFELLLTMEAGACWWMSLVFRQRPRPTLEANLAALVGWATRLPDNRARELAGDVHGWFTRAQVATGWEDRTATPYARCPVCDRLGSLRLKAGADDRAWCVGCTSEWSRTEGTIGLLADHLRASRDTAGGAIG